MASYYFIGQSVALTGGTFTNATFSGTSVFTGTAQFQSGIVVSAGVSSLGSTTVTSLTDSGALNLSNAAPVINASTAAGNLLALQSAGTTVLSLDKGGSWVPPLIDPSTYYFCYDWDDNASGASFAQGGNTGFAAVNTISAPLMVASTQGVAYCQTTTTILGGYVGLPTAYGIVKSSTINYQWRILFYMPAASTSANRYTAYIGAFSGISAANTSNGPFSGPWISYSDNANSGLWTLGSSIGYNGAGGRTTANSTTAPSFNAWNVLLITLANGTYTYTLNGTPLGTVVDANMLTTPTSSQSANAGGIQILPDGTNFTTARTLMIDRSDYYVTGLTR